MGLYIETPHYHGKAEWLTTNAGATAVPVELGDIPRDAPEGEVLVCVVDNGMFEAAAVAVTEADKERFASTQNGSDTRPRQWLRVPLTEVKRLVGKINAEGYGL